MRTILMAFAATGYLTQAASAQDAGSRQSRDFVEAAAASDTFEMMEAYSALAQSKDPAVIAFANQMIRDHAETSRALSAAAQSAGLKPPTMQISAALAPLLASLQSARGADFDQTYWKQQVLAHSAALVTEQHYAAAGDAAALKRAAAATVPVIEAHLSMARNMSTKTGP